MLGIVLSVIGCVFIARQVFAWRGHTKKHLMRGPMSLFPTKGSGERGSAQAVGFLRVGGKIVDDVVTTWSPA